MAEVLPAIPQAPAPAQPGIRVFAPTQTGLAVIPEASGDVAGPEVSTDWNFAAFSGVTGKLLRDSGYNPSSFAEAPVAPPVAANSPGYASLQSYDADYFYVCIANNSWIRFAKSTWV